MDCQETRMKDEGGRMKEPGARRCSSFILHPSSLPARRGFSFAEVLFAVIVLGVGFIMIAAIFPVAIQQSKVTTDESRAAAIARGAVDVIARHATASNFIPTSEVDLATMTTYPGRVFSIRNPQYGGGTMTPLPAAISPPESLWDSLRGNVIVPSDPRYAWIALYRRRGMVGGTADPYAQVYIIAAQATDRSIYQPTPDTDASTGDPPVNLQVRPVVVTITDDGGGAGVDTINFTAGEAAAVAEGCYVIIADDGLTGTQTGHMNGRIYRVGRNVAGAVWELIPGFDFQADPGPDNMFGTGDDITGGLTGANAWVLGRGLTAAGDYEGAAQDIYVYTTYVQVR